MKTLCKIILLFIAGSFLTACSFGRSGTIYYTASLNGNLAGCDCSVPVAGLVKRAAFLGKQDLENALIIDAGNVLEAGPDRILSRYILDIYRDNSYDLIVPGTQEFAEGAGAVAEYSRQYPLACANLKIKSGPEDWTFLGSPAPQIFKRNNINYEVIPLMGTSLFYLYPPEFFEKVYIEDPLKVLRRIFLETDRQEVTLVLFHGTGEEARRLAEEAGSELDILIFAGEEKLVEDRLPGGTLLLSPGEEGNRLGTIRVSVRGDNIPRFTNSFREFSYFYDPDDLAASKQALEYKSYLDRQINRETSLIKGPVELYYTPRCRSCDEILPKIKSVDTALLLSIDEPENYERLMAEADRRSTEIRNFPVLLWGDHLIQGMDSIRSFLSTGEIPREVSSPGRFSGLALPVLGAGLLDGINPCAFTTILFLVSSLSISGAGRRKQWRSGLVFAGSVFVFYLAVGAGFFKLLESASYFPLLVFWGHRILVGILILFAALNLYDAFQFRKNRSDAVLLQLPEGMKKRIHHVIRNFRKGSLSVGAAVVLGFMVSLFELGCTGQIYLPTIAYMIEKGGTGKGILLLLLYNGGFILPLLAVLIAAMAGTGVEKIGRFFTRNLFPVKLVMSGLFLVFAVSLM